MLQQTNKHKGKGFVDTCTREQLSVLGGPTGLILIVTSKTYQPRLHPVNKLTYTRKVCASGGTKASGCHLDPMIALLSYVNNLVI